MNRMVFLVLLVFGLYLTSCNTPVLESSTPKRFYIASDFLQPKDAILFKDFSKKEKTRVVILNWTADSIEQHYAKFGYSSKFDAVLMKTTFAVNQFTTQKILHPIEANYLWQNKDFEAPNKEWITLGIDPYVIAGLKEKKVMHYNDLTWGNKWENKLTPEEMKAFNGAVVYQFGRKNLQNSIKWLKKLHQQIAPAQPMLVAQPDSLADSTALASFYLTRLSKINPKKEVFVYPSQIVRLGAFYDGINFGIARHSSKYITALHFIAFYTQPLNNQKLSKRLHVLPVENPHKQSPFDYQNNYPILFRGSPGEIAPIFRNLSKIEVRIYGGN
ncbi:MAG TPA: hypothetical protein PKN22_02170 [Taishania sp.]|nr:hypothetical protein [Taishania sp.]